jgi:hypothetical protein
VEIRWWARPDSNRRPSDPESVPDAETRRATQEEYVWFWR